MPRKRFRPGTIALREIKYYQKKTGAILALAPFQRLVKDIIITNTPSLRVSQEAMLAYREVVESYMVATF